MLAYTVGLGILSIHLDLETKLRIAHSQVSWIASELVLLRLLSFVFSLLSRNCVSLLLAADQYMGCTACHLSLLGCDVSL